jgi:hypothetical protein
MALPERWLAQPLTAQQRAALRAAVDAVRREMLRERRHTHRQCPGCRELVHRADFPGGRGALCHVCQALADATGGGGA